jgi:hypothetical protein
MIVHAVAVLGKWLPLEPERAENRMQPFGELNTELHFKNDRIHSGTYHPILGEQVSRRWKEAAAEISVYGDPELTVQPAEIRLTVIHHKDHRAELFVVKME